MYYICYIYICTQQILQLRPACRGGPAAAEEEEEERAARAVAGQRQAGQRSLGVAIPRPIRMSLQAMKSAHEPVVVGLAGMIQEQPATGLAGIDLADICITMQEICGKREQYAVIMSYVQKICSYMSQICKEYAVIYTK